MTMFYRFDSRTLINVDQIVSLNYETNLAKESKLIIAMSNGERYKLTVGNKAETDFKEFMEIYSGLKLAK